MANMERGAYEPRIDDIRAFDTDTDMDDAEEGSRLPLLIVIALLVLAAFAGVVWLAYTQGVERGRADAPRIAAAANPHERASGQTPFTGLQIYQHPGHRITANAVPALRPTATAAEPPAPVPSPSPAPPNAVAQQPAASVPAKPQAPPQMPAAPKRAAAAASGPAVAETTPESTPATTQISGVLLQIGSYKSEAEARASWLAFKRRHPLAASYQYDVKEVDLGPKGVWYRLRIGSFADKESAGAVCEKLKQDGASCLVAR